LGEGLGVRAGLREGLGVRAGGEGLSLRMIAREGNRKYIISIHISLVISLKT